MMWEKGGVLGARRDIRRVRRRHGHDSRDATGAIAGPGGSGTDGGCPVVSASSHGSVTGVDYAALGTRTDGNHICSDTRTRNRTRIANVSLGTDDATRRRPPAPGAIRHVRRGST